MEEMRAQARALRRRDHRRATSRPSICRSDRSASTVGEDGVHRRRADSRHRRVGEVARPRRRQEALGPRRLDVRDLRRLLLQGPADRGRRRRRHGDGGSDLSVEAGDDGHRDPSPRHAARLEGDAGQGARRIANISFIWNTEVIDIKDVEKGEVTSLVLKNLQTGEAASWPSTACSSPSATSRTPSSSPGQLDARRERLHRDARRHAHERAGRVRGRRRAGSRLSAGGDRCRIRLHGGDRCGAFLVRARARRERRTVSTGQLSCQSSDS